MTGTGWLPPWRRGKPVAAVEHVPPQVRRHVVSVPVGPQAVARAREAVTARFAEAGVMPRSAFADAVLLVVSELVTNVLRHAPRSPFAGVGVTVGSGQLVISVQDTGASVPQLSGDGMGAGLRMVAELAGDYDGDLSCEPAFHHSGKIVLVRFEIPR
ncbi:ATP-binding protein [Streptomyces mauvecolor]|uniref:ATP-binding protein n=1 Tax=Streptomyces mauvecolor TaxID=58345 RepID=A0ABV9UV96_9ACTN